MGFCKNKILRHSPLLFERKGRKVQYHEVKVNLEFRELTDCYFAGTWDGSAVTASQSAVVPGSLGTTSLFVD